MCPQPPYNTLATVFVPTSVLTVKAATQEPAIPENNKVCTTENIVMENTDVDTSLSQTGLEDIEMEHDSRETKQAMDLDKISPTAITQVGHGISEDAINQLKKDDVLVDSNIQASLATLDDGIFWNHYDAEADHHNVKILVEARTSEGEHHDQDHNGKNITSQQIPISGQIEVSQESVENNDSIDDEEKMGSLPIDNVDQHSTITAETISDELQETVGGDNDILIEAENDIDDVMQLSGMKPDETNLELVPGSSVATSASDYGTINNLDSGDIGPDLTNPINTESGITNAKPIQTHDSSLNTGDIDIKAECLPNSTQNQSGMTANNDRSGHLTGVPIMTIDSAGSMSGINTSIENKNPVDTVKLTDTSINDLQEFETAGVNKEHTLALPDTVEQTTGLGDTQYLENVADIIGSHTQHADLEQIGLEHSVESPSNQAPFSNVDSVQVDIIRHSGEQGASDQSTPQVITDNGKNDLLKTYLSDQEESSYSANIVNTGDTTDSVIHEQINTFDRQFGSEQTQSPPESLNIGDRPLELSSGTMNESGIATPDHVNGGVDYFTKQDIEVPDNVTDLGDIEGSECFKGITSSENKNADYTDKVESRDTAALKQDNLDLTTKQLQQSNVHIVDEYADIDVTSGAGVLEDINNTESKEQDRNSQWQDDSLLDVSDVNKTYDFGKDVIEGEVQGDDDVVSDETVPVAMDTSNVEGEQFIVELSGDDGDDQATKHVEMEATVGATGGLNLSLEGADAGSDHTGSDQHSIGRPLSISEDGTSVDHYNSYASLDEGYTTMMYSSLASHQGHDVVEPDPINESVQSMEIIGSALYDGADGFIPSPQDGVDHGEPSQTGQIDQSESQGDIGGDKHGDGLDIVKEQVGIEVTTGGNIAHDMDSEHDTRLEIEKEQSVGVEPRHALSHTVSQELDNDLGKNIGQEVEGELDEESGQELGHEPEYKLDKEPEQEPVIGNDNRLSDCSEVDSLPEPSVRSAIFEQYMEQHNTPPVTPTSSPRGKPPASHMLGNIIAADPIDLTKSPLYLIPAREEDSELFEGSSESDDSSTDGQDPGEYKLVHFKHPEPRARRREKRARNARSLVQKMNELVPSELVELSGFDEMIEAMERSGKGYDTLTGTEQQQQSDVANQRNAQLELHGPRTSTPDMFMVNADNELGVDQKATMEHQDESTILTDTSVQDTTPEVADDDTIGEEDCMSGTLGSVGVGSSLNTTTDMENIGLDLDGNNLTSEIDLEPQTVDTSLDTPYSTSLSTGVSPTEALYIDVDHPPHPGSGAVTDSGMGTDFTPTDSDSVFSPTGKISSGDDISPCELPTRLSGGFVRETITEITAEHAILDMDHRVGIPLVNMGDEKTKLQNIGLGHEDPSTVPHGESLSAPQGSQMRIKNGAGLETNFVQENGGLAYKIAPKGDMANKSHVQARLASVGGSSRPEGLTITALDDDPEDENMAVELRSPIEKRVHFVDTQTFVMDIKPQDTSSESMEDRPDDHEVIFGSQSIMGYSDHRSGIRIAEDIQVFGIQPGGTTKRTYVPGPEHVLIDEPTYPVQANLEHASVNIEIKPIGKDRNLIELQYDRHDMQPMEGHDQEEIKPTKEQDRDDVCPIESNNREEVQPMKGKAREAAQPIEENNIEVFQPMEGSDREVVQPTEGSDKESCQPMERSDKDVVQPMEGTDKEVITPMEDSDRELLQPMEGNDKEVVQPIGGSDQEVVQPMEGSDQEVVQPMEGSDQEVVQPMEVSDREVLLPLGGIDKEVVQPMEGSDQEVVQPMEGSAKEVVQPMEGSDREVFLPLGGIVKEVVQPMEEHRKDVVQPMEGSDRDVFQPMERMSKEVVQPIEGK